MWKRKVVSWGEGGEGEVLLKWRFCCWWWGFFVLLLFFFLLGVLGILCSAQGVFTYCICYQDCYKKNAAWQSKVSICVNTLCFLFLSYLSRSLADGWGTTVDFTTSLLHSSRLSAFRSMMFYSKPVHFLMLSSHRFLCLPLLLPPWTVPFTLCLPDFLRYCELLWCLTNTVLLLLCYFIIIWLLLLF